MRLAPTLALAATLAACGSHGSQTDSGRAPALPSRTGPLATPAPSALSLTGEAVKSGTQIVVDLDEMPSPTRTWAPWSCQSVLPPDFVLGQATCANGSGKTTPITANMTQQVCSGDPKFGPAVQPTANLWLPGCGAATLSFYGFTPPLRVSLVTAR